MNFGTPQLARLDERTLSDTACGSCDQRTFPCKTHSVVNLPASRDFQFFLLVKYIKYLQLAMVLRTTVAAVSVAAGLITAAASVPGRGHLGPTNYARERASEGSRPFLLLRKLQIRRNVRR